MKTQTSNAIAYSLDMLSFAFFTPETGTHIQAVYLFGSAMRGELHVQSDIDIFIECKKSGEKIMRHLIDSAILKFLASKDYQKWKLLKFTYPFTVHLGQLQEWDLRLSISSEGLQLYNTGNIVPTGDRSVMFVIKYPMEKKKYIYARRLLFGRDEKEYLPAGLVQKLGGRKLSPHVFIIPKNEQTRMIDTLSNAKIEFSMKEIVLLQA